MGKTNSATGGWPCRCRTPQESGDARVPEILGGYFSVTVMGVEVVLP
jgi:hypothetical protein